MRESGLPNQTDAMFTTIEGDWDETLAVVKRAVDAVAARAPRVSLVLKADLRPGVTDAPHLQGRDRRAVPATGWLIREDCGPDGCCCGAGTRPTGCHSPL